MNNLCDLVLKLMQSGTPPRGPSLIRFRTDYFIETVITHLLTCIKDWLLADTNDLISYKNDRVLMAKVFQSLEITLLGDLVRWRYKLTCQDGEGERATRKNWVKS